VTDRAPYAFSNVNDIGLVGPGTRRSRPETCRRERDVEVAHWRAEIEHIDTPHWTRSTRRLVIVRRLAVDVVPDVTLPPSGNAARRDSDEGPYLIHQMKTE